MAAWTSAADPVSHAGLSASFAAWISERAGRLDRTEAALRAGAVGSWDRIRPLVSLLERQRRWGDVVAVCHPLTSAH